MAKKTVNIDRAAAAEASRERAGRLDRTRFSTARRAVDASIGRVA